MEPEPLLVDLLMQLVPRANEGVTAAPARFKSDMARSELVFPLQAPGPPTSGPTPEPKGIK